MTADFRELGMSLHVSPLFHVFFLQIVSVSWWC